MNGTELNLGLAQRSVVVAAKGTALLLRIQSRESSILELEALLAEIEELLSLTSDITEIKSWEFFCSLARLLLSQYQCSLAARQSGINLTEATSRYSYFFSETQGKLAEYGETRIITLLTGALDQSPAKTNPKAILDALLALPLPTIYMSKNKRWSPPVRTTTQTPPPLTLTVLVELDGSPLLSPQTIQAKVQHTLTFLVTGNRWPGNAEILELELLSTCPKGLYESSPFSLPKPEGLEQHRFQSTISGHLYFHAPHGLTADPVSFKVRPAYKTQNETIFPTSIGYTDLRFRAIDPDSRNFASGYKRMDMHVEGLLQQFLTKHPEIKSELAELLPMLEALTRLHGVFIQSATFKNTKDLSENEFQQIVVERLRMLLGEEIQEHTQQVGGPTDLRYKGLIVELKVEKKLKKRESIRKKYTKQPTQYSSIEARQVSIVLVLDLTEKTNPPGDIRNDIFLEDVAIHGSSPTTQYPAKAFVFIVNGNIRNPSFYSA